LTIEEVGHDPEELCLKGGALLLDNLIDPLLEFTNDRRLFAASVVFVVPVLTDRSRLCIIVYIAIFTK
jgi:hypothetical protein